MSKDVLLGVVIGPQGLRGKVKVKAFTETPQGLGAYGPLRTRDGQGLKVLDISEAKGFAIVALEGITTRSAAEKLKGSELYVPRTALPEIEPQEFYHADLLGLRAEDTEGRSIGKVIAIHNFGASDVIEIARDDGDGTVLMPFTNEVVPAIDIPQGRIVIAAPEEVEAARHGTVE